MSVLCLVCLFVLFGLCVYWGSCTLSFVEHPWQLSNGNWCPINSFLRLRIAAVGTRSLLAPKPIVRPTFMRGVQSVPNG